MKDATPRAIRLDAYKPFTHEIDEVALEFRLDPHATRVKSRIAFRPNPKATPGPLHLDGENLTLIGAWIDGQPVTPCILPDGLVCETPDRPFVWECEVEIDPAGNTALEGLYMSNGMFCTQCEAEGFRKITYYPDRPDVMAPFTVKIHSDLPVRLSNGNPAGSGEGNSTWIDPWKKPAYLFALVAGDLVAHSDSFTTMEGREVALNIWVRPGDEDKCAYAMDALKRSMRWDETEYGRAYDLDVFNIVAVRDFNMGAMENKGLNIFNSRYVLASPETATDGDYARIEAIIAHEYFHNWTGNRITCRDWFQLCLKEGLTVYRDQQFSGDMRSHGVKRIEDVQMLRARQFREDAGPLAHPVRPESYIEINNFYTATVYEKGAEVIGMLRRLVGAEAYRRALDLYFERHDGQACTIEDWLRVFEEATGRDLKQFRRWYTQAGTPHVTATTERRGGTLALTLAQETPPTPGQPDKAPQVLPIAVGAIGPGGSETMATQVLELTEARQTFEFDLPEGSVLSLNRGFSAPVALTAPVSNADRALLLARDTDPFNKWEAGRALAKDALIRMVADAAASNDTYLDALGPVLCDDTLDPAFRALILGLPSEDDLAQTLHAGGTTPDPLAIRHALLDLSVALANRLQEPLSRLFDEMRVPGAYTPDAEAAGRRSLRLAALSLLSHLDGGERAQALFDVADNMTEESGALAILLKIGKGHEALAAFRDRWSGDRLVMDKWFTLQVLQAPEETAPAIATALTGHPDFDWRNPNRFRAVFGALGANHAGFHAAGGSGYALLADWLVKLDPVNPQTTARMTTLFETWPRYDADRQDQMREALRKIAAAPDLSRDTAEMVTRILGAGG